jgi:hypothetical protein
MGQQHGQPAFYRAPITAPRAFDLLGDVGDIDGGEIAQAQQPRLLDGPSVEVFFVIDRVAGHHRFSNHARLF